MTAQRRNHFVSDFPGIPALRWALAGWAVFWPWASLHGVARVAVGIPWTGCTLVIAGLIALGKTKGNRR